MAVLGYGSGGGSSGSSYDVDDSGDTDYTSDSDGWDGTSNSSGSGSDLFSDSSEAYQQSGVTDSSNPDFTRTSEVLSGEHDVVAVDEDGDNETDSYTTTDEEGNVFTDAADQIINLTGNTGLESLISGAPTNGEQPQNQPQVAGIPIPIPSMGSEGDNSTVLLVVVLLVVAVAYWRG